MLHSSLKASRPIQVRLLNYRADGSLFVNDLTVMPIVDRATNTTSHFLGILRERPLPDSQRHLPSIDEGVPAAPSEHSVGGLPPSQGQVADSRSSAGSIEPTGGRSSAGGASADNGAPVEKPGTPPLHIPTQLQEALQVRLIRHTRSLRPLCARARSTAPLPSLPPSLFVFALINHEIFLQGRVIVHGQLA